MTTIISKPDLSKIAPKTQPNLVYLVTVRYKNEFLYYAVNGAVNDFEAEGSFINLKGVILTKEKAGKLGKQSEAQMPEGEDVIHRVPKSAIERIDNITYTIQEANKRREK